MMGLFRGADKKVTNAIIKRLTRPSERRIPSSFSPSDL